MSFLLQPHDLRATAPRLIGGAAAAAVLVLGAACSSGSAADIDGAAADTSEDTAALSDGVTLVAAVGPSVGPIEPEVVIDETPPGLAVTSPAPGSSVGQSSFVFAGFTEPGATVAVGNVETIATESGHWSVELELSEGPNTAVVKTKDAAGNEFHKEVIVNYEKPLPYVEKPKPVYEPPKDEHKPNPEATVVKEKHYEFTAWTKFGICTTEPFAKTGGEGSKDTDVLTKFKGNGVPGTLVTVTSPYGGGTAEVDDSGYWWVKIEFTEGAAQAEFTAVVTTGEHVARFRCGAI